MDTTACLLHRYLNEQATPAEILELEAIAANEGITLQELIVRDSFTAFNDHFNTIKASEADFAPQSFRRQKISPALPELPPDPVRKPEAKVIPLNRGFRWLPVAATLTALLLLSGIAYWIHTIGVVETTSVGYSGKSFVVLPDNSTVILNEGSKLILSAAFGESNRTVFLEGEGLFDIRHDPAQPFIVHTGKVRTTVVGTRFNIRDDEGKITITVAEGLVKVADDQRMHEAIRPDEQIEFDITTNDFIRRKVKAEEALAWQKDFLILYDITFSEAAARIEKRFNVNVTITNNSLKKCMVLSSFLHNETLQEVLQGLILAQQAAVKIEGNNVIIDGGQGCN